MAVYSRTRNSAVNASVAFVFYIASLILQFISRRVFIQYLGSDVLGLNTTATSLLQFLNMAEMGLGAAVAFSLYKPIAEHDDQTVKEIIAVQGWFYKRIATFVLLSSVILSFFFPQIFAKSHLPLWYAYSTFGVLLVGSMLSYIFNYKQIILSANQLEYKILIANKGPKLIKDLLQIISICLFPQYGYILWVLFEGLGFIVCTISINIQIKKTFPEIYKTKLDGGALRIKYPVILKKVKQLLFHKIGGFVLFQMSPIIIYAFTNLTLVAIYGNYMLIVLGLTMLLSTVYNGLGAGIGNVIQTCNKVKILEIFREVYLVRFYLVVSCCMGFYLCSSSITILWVGEKFLLPTSTVIIIIINMYLNMIRPPVELFLQAKGMYQDIWAPIIESSINLGLSTLLGYYYGLNGILTGIAISLFIIPTLWKPFFLFKIGFQEEIRYYIKMTLKFISIALINCSICLIVWYHIINYYNISEEIIKLIIGIFSTIFFMITTFYTMLICEHTTKTFKNRIISLLRRKI